MMREFFALLKNEYPWEIAVSIFVGWCLLEWLAYVTKAARRGPSRLRRLLCWLGLHRWENREHVATVGGWTITSWGVCGRCGRPRPQSWWWRLRWWLGPIWEAVRAWFLAQRPRFGSVDTFVGGGWARRRGLLCRLGLHRTELLSLRPGKLFDVCHRCGKAWRRS